MAFDVGQELTRKLAEYEAQRGKSAYRLLVLARERDELEATIKQLDAAAYATELAMAAWNRRLVELGAEAEEAARVKAEKAKAKALKAEAKALKKSSAKNK